MGFNLPQAIHSSYLLPPPHTDEQRSPMPSSDVVVLVFDDRHRSPRRDDNGSQSSDSYRRHKLLEGSRRCTPTSIGDNEKGGGEGKYVPQTESRLL